MATLTDDVKAFIVKELAMYQSPQDVADAVKEEFGVTITRQQVYTYDPEGALAHKLADKWKALHAETRKKFDEERATVGITIRMFRLRELDRMMRRAKRMGNMALAAQFLKQAAEEMGGAYTNRREVTGKGGGPIEAKVDLSAATPEQLRALAGLKLTGE